MNADPADQLRLLDLQAADTALAQLAHRRRTLPELAQLAAKEKDAAEVNNRVIDAQTLVADIELEQRRLENDVDTVRTRAAKDDARLQSGGLPSRELEGLQHEIASLARRQSSLEDDLLDVMERAEQAGATLGVATSDEQAVRAEVSELQVRRDSSFGEIDDAIGQREPQRAAIASALPPDLLALYEKSRASGGHGAAMLRQRRCEGCRIELSGSEVSALRAAAPAAVVRCENCRAILVRTSESGL
ncbi:zinc ribbon domain-containing protein [uncultured Jatrophihabitans sp.]|uniref:zinc ribbon domain-containing protein n=1 Tax=uncultured Jatrophihabitans sp. TaxID=1610747 RepID=UPI0035CBB123